MDKGGTTAVHGSPGREPSPPHAIRSTKHARRRTRRVLLMVLALLLADFALYPLLAPAGGANGNRGEICPDGDPHFLALMRETRAALPTGALLSTATPIRLPAPLTRRWGWSDGYFGQVAALCDQICVMTYDTGMYLPRAYVELARSQVVHVTQAVAESNPQCRVLIGVPTYARGGPSHLPWSENLKLALKGVREGLADPRSDRTVFGGVAPFADYTTQPDEWRPTAVGGRLRRGSGVVR